MPVPVTNSNHIEGETRRVNSVFRYVLISLACSAALDAVPAFATCGDYLYRNGRPVSHAVGNGEMSESQTHLPSADQKPFDAPLPGRCSGPHCSSNPLPERQLPASPSNLVQGFDQAAILGSLLRDLKARRGRQIPESEQGVRFEPLPVYRPPAAGSRRWLAVNDTTVV